MDIIYGPIETSPYRKATLEDTSLFWTKSAFYRELLPDWTELYVPLVSTKGVSA